MVKASRKGSIIIIIIIIILSFKKEDRQIANARKSLFRSLDSLHCWNDETPAECKNLQTMRITFYIYAASHDAW